MWSDSWIPSHISPLHPSCGQAYKEVSETQCVKAASDGKYFVYRGAASVDNNNKADVIDDVKICGLP